MMKRIISLILVVALSVLALVGCGYKYSKDDMSKYAEIDKAKLLAALKTLEIADGDFGTDETKRLEKVEDKIFSDLASKADKTVKVTTGTVGKYDVLYYCYYVTVEKDGTTHILYADKMTESKATSFQLGLSSLEGLNAKIAELVAGKTLDGYVYSTVTSLTDDTTTETVDESKLKDGDVVYVSYTKKVENLDSNGEVVSTLPDVKVSHKKVVISSDDPFTSKLIGKTVSSTALTDAIVLDPEGEGQKETYSSVTIHWLVKDENEIGTVVDTPYGEDDEETKQTSADGTEVVLNGLELTYHIFPVYVVEVAEELTAEIILENYYSLLTATGYRDSDADKHIFGCMDAGFKNGNDTLLALAEQLIDDHKALDTAEDNEDAAKKVVSDAGGAEKATDDQNKAYEDAKTATQNAKDAIAATVAKILACTNDEGKDVKAELVQSYRDYRYYVLEYSYENTVVQNVAKAIYTLAQSEGILEYTGELPKKAVKQAYERIENAIKLEFYEMRYDESTRTVKSDSESYQHLPYVYAVYNGDYDAYLMSKYSGTKSVEEAEAKIQAEAEEAVREVVFVYALADALGIEVSKEQEKEFKQSETYILLKREYGKQFTENDYMPILLFNNIFDYLLERSENEGKVVVFKNVVYTIKADDAE